MQLVGLGTADWAYAFGPTFEPNGRCFDVDGTSDSELRVVDLTGRSSCVCRPGQVGDGSGHDCGRLVDG